MAFLFLNMEEAEEAGLAKAWQAANSNAFADVTQRAAPCLAAVSPAVPAAQPIGREFRLRRVRPPRKHAARTALQDEAARRHAASLAVRLSIGWAPTAGLAARWPDVLPEQRKLFNEACVRRLAKFEARAIFRHLRVWEHWRAWAKSHSIPELTAAAPFVEQFIETSSGAKTAARATWDSFAWLHKHLDAPFCVDAATRPTRIPQEGEVDEEEQAPVCEPEILVYLEGFAAELYQAKDWRFGPVLGALIEAFSGLRFCHLQRSSLLARTETAFIAQCYRGKSRVEGARPAFRWRCPAFGLTGVPLATWVFEAWATWKAKDADHIGIVCDFLSGRALSIAQYNDVLREAAEPVLFLDPDSPTISSYSFRRVLPTYADLRELPSEKRLPLGGWRDAARAPDGRKANPMPIRYADRKYLTEEVAKVVAVRVLAAAMREAEKPRTWESVRAVLPGIDTASIEDQAQADVAAANKHNVMAHGVSKRKLGQEVRRLRLRPSAGAAPTGQPGIDRAWLVARGGKGYTHFLCQGPGSQALCRRKQKRGGTSFARPAAVGVGLAEIAGNGRAICPACFAELPVGERNVLSQ